MSVLGPVTPGRPCPNWLSRCLWEGCSSVLTTPLAMSFHLVPGQVYFAATHDSFLSVLYLHCTLSLGGKTAMRFPSATASLFFTDPVPLSSSPPSGSSDSLTGETSVLSLVALALGSLKLDLLFCHHCMETLLARSVIHQNHHGIFL